MTGICKAPGRLTDRRALMAARLALKQMVYPPRLHAEPKGSTQRREGDTPKGAGPVYGQV